MGADPTPVPTSGGNTAHRRRRWIAIASATVPMFLSFSSLVAAFTADAAVDRTAALGVGLTFVPFVFVILAFVSRHENAALAVLKSLGVWVLVSMSTALVSLVLAGTVGFGLAGMFSLRAGEQHSYRSRAIGVGLLTVYVTVLLVAIPSLGVASAATLPLVALGVADSYADRLHAEDP